MSATVKDLEEAAKRLHASREKSLAAHSALCAAREADDLAAREHAQAYTAFRKLIHDYAFVAAGLPVPEVSE